MQEKQTITKALDDLVEQHKDAIHALTKGNEILAETATLRLEESHPDHKALYDKQLRIIATAQKAAIVLYSLNVLGYKALLDDQETLGADYTAFVREATKDIKGVTDGYNAVIKK